MLSILILSYNYNLYPLVERLHRECTSLNIDFEIICTDDHSTEHFQNKTIETLDHCQYHIQPANIGRSRSRNFLIERAQNDCIIMLDSDTYPTTENFVSNYLSKLSQDDTKFISGGLKYQDERPAKSERLRWIYGRVREAYSAEVRQKKPYSYISCTNICFSKKHLNQLRFPHFITGYGYEDFTFFKDLAKNNIEVLHLENEVYHLKLETSQEFLDKTKQGIITLKQLLDQGSMSYTDTLLAKNYYRVQRLGLQKAFLFLYGKFQKKIVRNLTSPNPNLLLFDLYKLAELTALSQK